MNVTETIQAYLQKRSVSFAVVPHFVGPQDLDLRKHLDENTLQAGSDVFSPFQYAKAIVVRSAKDYRMCVIPAAHVLILDWLNRDYSHPYKVVPDAELEKVIPGCKAGALPALGQVFGMKVVWDSALRHQEKIYIEAGDDRHLLDFDNSAFQQLMKNGDRATISCPPKTARFLKALH